MYMKKYVGAICKYYKARNTKGKQPTFYVYIMKLQLL